MLKQSIIDEKLNDSNKILNETQLPQWPRVQFGKDFATNIRRNNKFNLPPVTQQQMPESILKLSDSIMVEPNRNNSDLIETTNRLKYLEKSIKFIQEQHNQTLNGLHDEMEKLKGENRDLHFKLATFTLERNSSKSTDKSTTITNSDNNNNSSTTNVRKPSTTSQPHAPSILSIRDPILEQKFIKVLDDTSNEANLDKRLVNIKAQYENKKLEELLIRLNESEKKNEYLNSVVSKLQEKRNLNSAYRPNQVVTDTLSKRSQSSINLSIGVNHIYSIDPLRITLNENETPREPCLEECQILVRKLFEMHKQQKQQISNMKAVLKDMLHTENLSNQGMMMTRDVLENSSRMNKYHSEVDLNAKPIPKLISKYTIDDNKKRLLNIKPNNFKLFIRKVGLSVHETFNPMNNKALITNQYKHSLLSTNNALNIDLNSNSNQQNVAEQQQTASRIHLPPLPKTDTKFTDRQRRTHLLQKQRLRKEHLN